MQEAVGQKVIDAFDQHTAALAKAKQRPLPLTLVVKQEVRCLPWRGWVPRCPVGPRPCPAPLSPCPPPEGAACLRACLPVTRPPA